MEVSFPVDMESHQPLSLRFLQIVLRKIFSHITAICLTCVEVNHIHVLVKMASSWYCKVRFSHFARRKTEMAKAGKT